MDGLAVVVQSLLCESFRLPAPSEGALWQAGGVPLACDAVLLH